MLRSGLFLACFSALHAVGAPLSAQPPEQPQGADAPSESDEARRLFEEGRTAYDEARYEVALELFLRSESASGRAELRFNVAMCFERLERWQDAIDAFETYLARVPDAANRAAVEARIRAARERLARAARATPPPASEAPSPVGPVIAIGASSAVAVVGAILLGLGTGRLGSLEGTPAGTRAWSDVEREVGSANALQGVGIGALIAGVIGAALGVVWLLSRGGGEARPAPAAVSVRR